MAAQSDGGGAARLLREVYGAEALLAIDSALARPGVDVREARRLEALRSSIVSP
jgi:hypothetical protein